MSVAEPSKPLGPPTTRFLYQAVAEVLRERILSRAYGPGSRIPTFAELAAEFNVSTITVRHAIRELSLEGMLVGRQGLGVFVAQKTRIIRTLSVDRIVPIEQDMMASGIRATLRDRGVKEVPPGDQPFLVELGRGHKRLIRLDRTLLADGEPVGIDILWLTSSLSRKLNDLLHGKFLMSQLNERGIPVESLTYQVQAATANEEQASLLGVVSGFPLLVVRFFPVAPDGGVILVGETTTRADRFVYEFGARQKSKGRGVL
jgi:GntR family transcriptional regulator